MFNEKVRMIEDVKNGKRIFNPVVYLLVGWIFYFLATVMMVIVTDFLLADVVGETIANEPFPNLVTMLLSFIFYALLVFFFVRVVEGRKITSLGLYKEGWFSSLLIGIGWGLGLISLAMLFYKGLGLVTVDDPSTQPTGVSALPYVLALFLAFLVQGGTEEIVNRGWLLNTISAKYNKMIGFGVSTFYFCSVHFFNSGFNLIVVINIILFSALLCMFVFRGNNLWYAIGFHGAWNFAIGNIYGMDVSGVKMGAGSLFDLSVHGNEWITGGVFGIEAGVLVTAVLIIGILVQLLLELKRKAPIKTKSV